MSVPTRFTLVACLAALLHALAPSSIANAQCSPTAGGGWHPDPAGTTPGCVPLMDAPGGLVTRTLPANDDGNTAPIDLTSGTPPAFPGGLQFFGGPYTTMVLNNNGNLTFGSTGLYIFTPSELPAQPRRTAAAR